MSFTRCSHLAALLVATTFALPAQTSPPQAAEAPPASHVSLPQIVRLSLVEGDVRIARGKHNEKLTGNAWEHAAPDVPLQSGFSLATGIDGRAEIEFEDTSTLYLAPNSALTFSELTTKDGVPHTSLALLSGTMTINLEPTVAGENYILQSATHTLEVHYGEKSYARITSYLDGLQVTPLDNTQLTFNHSSQSLLHGATYNLYGYAVFPKPPTTTPEMIAWDGWVKNRIATRAAAMQSVMHAAGLSAPLPGLADLAGKGTFISCAPYGTCWQPNDGWVQQHDSSPAAATNADASAISPSANQDQSTPIRPLPESQGTPGQSTPNVMNVSSTKPRYSGAGTPRYGFYDDEFPCNPYQFWYRHSLLINTNFYYPYDWTVCHAGFWINRNHRYMWVASTHKHHRCPVRWVKYQGKLGYVPVHPHDQTGRPPVNLRHGLYTLTDKPDHPIERVAFDNKGSPKLLETTPKEFRNAAPPVLARAESPELSVHFMHESPRTNISGTTTRTSTSLAFDKRSNRFMLATHVTDGGRTRTFTEPMSDRGGHIATASAGGYHAGSSASGLSHAAAPSGGRSGGFHGGAGASAGGHLGGGGSSGSGSSGGGSSSSSAAGSHR